MLTLIRGSWPWEHLSVSVSGALCSPLFYLRWIVIMWSNEHPPSITLLNEKMRNKKQFCVYKKRKEKRKDARLPLESLFSVWLQTYTYRGKARRRVSVSRRYGCAGITRIWGLLHALMWVSPGCSVREGGKGAHAVKRGENGVYRNMTARASLCLSTWNINIKCWPGDLTFLGDPHAVDLYVLNWCVAPWLWLFVFL